MPNFKRNPLFRAADEAVRRQAREEWQRSGAARLTKELQQAAQMVHRPSSGTGHVNEALRQYLRTGFTRSTFNRMRGLPFKDMVGEVVRYSMQGGDNARLISGLLRELGPLGRLIKAFVRPTSGPRRRGLQGEIDSAMNFLQSFGYEILPPGERRDVHDVERSINAATEFLESQGFEVTGATRDPRRTPSGVSFDDPQTSDEQLTYPGGVPKTTTKGAPRKVVDTEVGRFPVTHPLITKEMVEADSSNVWSFGYDLDSQTLYVRFQNPDKVGNGPGPIYAYSQVGAQQFLSMLAAPSKGTWLWDNVRIRGTWSGHRYDYRLVMVRGGYVPRKATYVGAGDEKFIPRSIRVMNRSGRFRTLRSQLPEQFAPRLAPSGTPDRGTPDRGSPNRGGPNRGR